MTRDIVLESSHVCMKDSGLILATSSMLTFWENTILVYNTVQRIPLRSLQCDMSRDAIIQM